MSEVLASSSGRPPPGTSRRSFARTHGRKLLETIGENTRTMLPAEWKVAGQSVPKVDGRAFVTGRHRYTTDQERPGMLRGKILRPSFVRSSARNPGHVSRRGDARRQGRPRS